MPPKLTIYAVDHDSTCLTHSRVCKAVAYSRSSIQKTKSACLGVRADVSTKYPFIRSTLFHHRLLSNLDRSQVRHAQIGIIDQAVQLCAGVEKTLSTSACQHLTRLYCEQAYPSHLQGPQFRRRRRHSSRSSLCPGSELRTAATLEPAI